jgi:hypothetical protein
LAQFLRSQGRAEAEEIFKTVEIPLL